jgi:elongation factor P--(R)-beta-lysine ligase
MKLPFLRDRAGMLQKTRAFFSNRNVLEVDCPALSFAAPVALHIEVMQVALKAGGAGYLHTSPEYGMKRLLAQGIGDIYQISHVFRDGEIGPLHNPEFTMAEWYRCGFTFEEMIDETLDFIRLFLGELEAEQLTYRDAFLNHLGIDYTTQTEKDLLEFAQKTGIALSDEIKGCDKDALLQLLLSILIEPHLGKDKLLVLSTFPATQSALAKTKILPDGEAIACRFEVYYRGMELANGYHELTDPIEQRRRFDETNTERRKAGKDPLAIDEKFLRALDDGLPDCCGVAVGFDRLMLLRHSLQSLDPILPFSWDDI